MLQPVRTQAAPGTEIRVGTVTSLYQGAYHAVHYTECGPPDAERVVVCLHSMFQCNAEFDGLARVLGAAGFRVLCPDFAGHGRSGWRRDADEYGYPLFSNDIMAVIARSGAARVDVIGSSMGGFISMKMAHQGAPFRTLILNDVGAYSPKSGPLRVLHNLPPSHDYPDLPAIELALRRLLSASGPLPRSEWIRFVSRNIARHGTGFRLLYDPRIRRQLMAMTARDYDLWDKWARVCCPALVIRGEYSDMLDAAVAQRMTERPDTELLTVAGCGHRPWLWTAEQAAPVVEWLRRYPA
ncbi:alpha/beta fold hydrolase [Stella sp.]|uniref:alpha/beta fold hydrolase n=1 Tax=Stella sp. TaxID=2912054 RepID=UPI0035AF837E